MEREVRWKSVVALVASLSVLGCGIEGPTIVPVSGRVLIDGVPLTHGSIQFSPQGSRPSYGVLDAEGRFFLTCREPGDGAVVGMHRITVEGKEVISSTDTLTKVKWHAPKKYADALTSGLFQEIDGPAENLVINLAWENSRSFLEIIQETPEPAR